MACLMEQVKRQVEKIENLSSQPHIPAARLIDRHPTKIRQLQKKTKGVIRFLYTKRKPEMRINAGKALYCRLLVCRFAYARRRNKQSGMKTHRESSARAIEIAVRERWFLQEEA